MLPRLHGDKVVGEHLVLMVVDGDILCIVVRYRQESVVAAWIPETILNDDDTALRVLALLVVSVPLESLNLVKIELGSQRLVDKLDTGNDVVIGRVAVLALNLLEYGQSQGGTWVDRLPLRSWHPLTRVVKAILRARRTVQVDEDLKTELARPVDSLVEVASSALDVRSPGVVVCPVPDWNADQVEARVGNLLHVTVLNPVVPVLDESSVGVSVVGVLTESVLVDNAHRVWEHLEDAWRDLQKGC